MTLSIAKRYAANDLLSSYLANAGIKIYPPLSLPWIQTFFPAGPVVAECCSSIYKAIKSKQQ